MKTKSELMKILALALIVAFGTLTFTSCDDDAVVVEDCTNGIDDDGDGLIDCNDPDCSAAITCASDDPVVVLRGSIGTRTLYSDTIYLLDGLVYVDSLDELTILPGTIIKAEDEDGVDASALIIRRGATIMANGSASQPIIFTSINDGIKVGEKASTLDPAIDEGEWGGLIILGNAEISDAESNGVANVEGVPLATGIGLYGGSLNNDNSGKLNFISIRFTGTRLGPNDEIQGLTLAGVGNQTEITNIEVISSDDDGIEFFGGAVNVTNALIVYQADDGLDIDQSYSGTIDNATVYVYNPNAGNEAMEIDGPESTTVNTGGLYTITNSTFVNRGDSCRAATMKSRAQGTITNSVFKDFKVWFLVDGDPASDNYINGTLKITDCEIDASSLDNLIVGEDSTSTANIDVIFQSQDAGNTATNAFTKGATADYSWTWSAQLGLLD